MLVKMIKRLLKLNEIEAITEQAAGQLKTKTMFEALAGILKLKVNIKAADRLRVPADGPVIVVANHPTGGAEGILMTKLLQMIRPDFKFLVHKWFKLHPEFKHHFFFVDPAGSESDGEGNANGLKTAIKWVRRGGMLGVYPAGSVACYQGRRQGITDPVWRPQVARLIRLTRATVLPLYVAGRNSWRYQLAAMIHPRLRIPLLPRELINKRGKTFHFKIGRPVPFGDLADMNDEAMMEYLRQTTFDLADRPDYYSASVPVLASSTAR